MLTKQVRQFMVKAGQATPLYPTISDKKTQLLRYNLIKEELDELAEAYKEDDLTEVADAIIDLLYVVFGAAVAHGLTSECLQDLWDEVHRTNMEKFDGPVSETGKQLKPEGWEPPDLKKIIEKHSKNDY